MNHFSISSPSEMHDLYKTGKVKPRELVSVDFPAKGDEIGRYTGFAAFVHDKLHLHAYLPQDGDTPEILRRKSHECREEVIAAGGRVPVSLKIQNALNPSL